MTLLKFSEFKIISILNEVSAGKSVDDICKKYKISLSTFSKWEKYYNNLKTPIPEKRNKKLAELNIRLKNLFSQVCHANAKESIETA